MLAGYDTDRERADLDVVPACPSSGRVRAAADEAEGCWAAAPRVRRPGAAARTRAAAGRRLAIVPPAWILGRRALGEDEMGGYYVAPGTTIAICLYTLHRHPAFLGCGRTNSTRTVSRPDRWRPGTSLPSSLSARATAVHRQHVRPDGGKSRHCPHLAALFVSVGTRRCCSPSACFVLRSAAN